jgi:hypothetical protein
MKIHVYHTFMSFPFTLVTDPSQCFVLFLICDGIHFILKSLWTSATSSTICRLSSLANTGNIHHIFEGYPSINIPNPPPSHKTFSGQIQAYFP